MKRPNAIVVALTAAIAGGAGGAAVVLVTQDEEATKTVVQQPALANSRPVADGDALTAADIYKRDSPGVVFISAQVVERSESPFGFPQERAGVSTGSGFVIDDNGDILTNAHVVDGATRVTVQFADRKAVPAKVVGSDLSTDLALLRVDPDATDLKPLELGSSRDLQVGDPVVAIGNPFGLDRTLTTGVVSALQRRIEAPDGFAISNVIQTDAAINPGNSGGPLIDASGEVVGVNSQIATGGSGSQGNVGIGFAVPIETAERILPALRSGKAVERGYLGVTTRTVDEALAELDLPVDRGALVQTVEQGSPADRAGLEAGNVTGQLGGEAIVLGGDIVTKVDETPITSDADLQAAISEKDPGTTVQLTFVRGKATRTIEVRLGTRPSEPFASSTLP